MVYTWALVIILFSPDLAGYRDFVGVFPDKAACEKDRRAKVEEAKALGFRFAIECVELKGGSAT